MDLGEMVLAAGALGTAAFGIVEGGLKPWALGPLSLGGWGFLQLRKNMGPALWHTLRVAFGPGYERMLLGIYRGNRADVERTLRQGIRIGLTPDNAEELATLLETINGADLKGAAVAVRNGVPPTDAQRNALGRYELAADARVDAAIRMANLYYVGGQQVAASIVAVVLAVLAWKYVYPDPNAVSGYQAVALGIAAVPLAPVAKDVATAIQSAAKALKART